MRTIESILRRSTFKGKARLIRATYDAHESVIPYHGGRMAVDTSLLIDFEMYWNGGYEKECVNMLLGMADRDSVFVDVGANIGVYTIPFAKKVKQVIAFEPCQEFSDRLSKNLRLSDIENVTIHSVALWDDEREVTLYSPDDSMNNKSASILPINAELKNETKISTKRLDDVFNLTRLDVLKVDADGSDFKILLGARKTIERFHPIIMYEELDYPGVPGKEEAERFLASVGYKIKKIDELNRLATI